MVRMRRGGGKEGKRYVMSSDDRCEESGEVTSGDATKQNVKHMTTA
jgi:hypothetical protein